MKKVKIRIIRIISVAVSLIVMAGLLAACGGVKEEELDPNGLVFATNSTLIGYRDYVSARETAVTIAVTESLYSAVLTTDDGETASEAVIEKTLAIVDAKSFPEKQEDGVIKPGGVYEEQLKKFVPDDRFIVVKSIRGGDIVALAEASVDYMLKTDESNGEKFDDRFMHFTGAAFIYKKKNSKNNRIVETVLPNEKAIQEDMYYDVILNSTLAEDADYPAIKNAKYVDKNTGKVIAEYDESMRESIDRGNEFEYFLKYVKDSKMAQTTGRYIDKSQQDAPMIAIIVVCAVAGLALVGIIIAYYTLRNKQKKAKAKRGGAPRIDV